MKKLLSLLAMLFAVNFAYAQWTTGPGNINNTNSGNVGIGTSTPVTPLDVAGNLTLENTQNVPNAGAVLHFTGWTNGSTSYPGPTIKSLLSLSGPIHNYSSLQLSSYWDGYKNELTLINGKVGIGTANPDVNLHINEAISDSKPNGVVAPTKSVLKLSRWGTPGMAYNEGAEFRIGHGGPSYYGSQLDLFLNSGSNINGVPDQQAMTWLYNGNVGIGTTSPKALLDVGKPLSPGDLSAVLARLNEGTTTGSGTYLGIKGYDTQPPNSSIDPAQVKSFAIEHSFYGVTNSSINFFRGGGTTGGSIAFNTDQNVEQMRILYNGNVGIGTISPDQKLTVNGTIHSKEVKVDTSIPVPDYVFDADYKLATLTEVKEYIAKNHHLPEIPSAAQIEKDGLKLGEMNTLLLKKVEELTLHLIEKDQETKELRESKAVQQKQLDKLQQQLEALTKEVHKN